MNTEPTRPDGPLDEATPAPAPQTDAAPVADDGGGQPRRRSRGRRGGSSKTEAAPEARFTLAEPAEAVPSPAVPDAGDLFAAVLSGDFDQQLEAPADDAPAAPADVGEPVEGAPEETGDDAAKRVLLPDPDAPKLHKMLAQAGVGSRRDMEQAIEEGRVTVNGEVAHTGMRISFGDRIELDGRPVRVRIAPAPARVIAYHKPVGEVVTREDPQQRPTVFRNLPRLAHGKWQSVGRLDINTEGLMLFTTSGDLANNLMHPRFGVEREYAVRVLGTLEKEARERLLAGVEIDGQSAAFKSVEEGGGEGVNRWYRVVITEGRNREVRKLFDAVGLTVSRLIRVRYGCVVLPKGLKRGACVDLPEFDVKALLQLTGSGRSAHQRGSDPQRSRNEARKDPRKDGPRPSRPPEPKKTSKGRGDRGERGDTLSREDREPGDPSRIPNPLQQTFDRRAIQAERRSGGRDIDYENGPIPNPLQQTYDKRFVQGGKPASPFGKRASGGGGGGGGQPDPMRTAVGYIGADAFVRKLSGSGGRGGGRGGSGGGGGGGGRRGGR
ncbi:MAG: pseudouridine synthase [Proteobacteria bacterium]|nr:pseudouridine synthase [Pseudomonadota bacterium]